MEGLLLLLLLSLPEGSVLGAVITSGLSLASPGGGSRDRLRRGCLASHQPLDAVP